MEQEQTWVDRLVQPTRRTFADVQKTGAELLQQLDDGAASLTSAQKRSLREVLAGLGSPEIRTISGITSGWPVLATDAPRRNFSRTFVPSGVPAVHVNWVGRGERDL